MFSFTPELMIFFPSSKCDPLQYNQGRNISENGANAFMTYELIVMFDSTIITILVLRVMDPKPTNNLPVDKI